jgi:two-component system, NarL family, nitrate/nitrite response regulator NarL
MHDSINSSEQKIRAFVVSNHRLFAESLVVALRDAPGVEVIGHTDGLEDTNGLMDMKSKNIDIVVLESSNDCMSMLLTARDIKAALPSVKVLMLGLEPSEESVLGYIDGGVNGFVSEHSSLNQLIEAIKTVYRNEISYSPDLIKLAVSRLRKLSGKGEQPLMLSAREKEILQLMSHHLANKEIANRLGISTSTAKSHVHNILQKLKVTRRRDAIQKARSANIVTDRVHPSSVGNIALQVHRVTGSGKLPRVSQKS